MNLQSAVAHRPFHSPLEESNCTLPTAMTSVNFINVNHISMFSYAWVSEVGRNNKNDMKKKRDSQIKYECMQKSRDAPMW